MQNECEVDSRYNNSCTSVKCSFSNHCYLNKKIKIIIQ